MPEIYFVSGTDTDCGKTYCTVKLIDHYKKQGKSVIGLKPIASGCAHTATGLRNDDALKLQAASTIKLPYSVVNPFAFEPPIAPHVAAQHVGVRLSVVGIKHALTDALQTHVDIILIEGAGGLMTPLNEKELLIDLIKALNIPVFFVVGLKLGCINHTLLSLEALKNRGIPIAEIIYNPIDPHMLYKQETCDTIQLMHQVMKLE